MSDFSTFSQITCAGQHVCATYAGTLQRRTGILSLYFWRMRSASALRFSNGCSSLNLERILIVSVVVDGVVCFSEMQGRGEVECACARGGWLCGVEWKAEVLGKAAAVRAGDVM